MKLRGWYYGGVGLGERSKSEPYLNLLDYLLRIQERNWGGYSQFGHIGSSGICHLEFTEVLLFIEKIQGNPENIHMYIEVGFGSWPANMRYSLEPGHFHSQDEELEYSPILGKKKILIQSCILISWLEWSFIMDRLFVLFLWKNNEEELANVSFSTVLISIVLPTWNLNFLNEKSQVIHKVWIVHPSEYSEISCDLDLRHLVVNHTFLCSIFIM